MYRTREMAARALVPFVLVTQIPSTVQTLLQELPLEPGPKLQQNRIHGTLLQVCSHAHASINQDTHTHFVKMTPSWGGGVVLMIAKILVELDSKP